MPQITNSSKRGTRHTATVYGLSRETLESITPAVFDNGDGGFRVTAHNKREWADLNRAVEQPQPVSNPLGVRSSKRRRIESLERAELYGLEHGKSWICREIDVETKGASPEWEGSLICYVYEQ